MSGVRLVVHPSRKRKIFFLAANTGYVTNGEPDERCEEFYRSRSGGGLHCAIVGNVVTPSGLGSNDVCAKISTNNAWTRLAIAIKGEGALAGIQLSSAWTSYLGNRSFVAKNKSKGLQYYLDVAAALKKFEIEMAFESLQKGSDLAVNHGFDHIQLHAAHGYLFNLMLDSRFCEHAGLAVGYVESWARGLFARGVETSIRVSMSTGELDFDARIPGGGMDALYRCSVQYIDLSDGFYNINKRLIYPSTPDQVSSRINASLAVAARYPDKRFIVSGRSAARYRDNLMSNIDFGVCRDLIANPKFLVDDERGCENRMKCHYYSRGDNSLSCGRWVEKLM